MVNHPYKELYWKPHIDKQIKIIGVDFWGYGNPSESITQGNYAKYFGAVYLDMENKKYYQMNNLSPYQMGWEEVTENQAVIFKNSDIQWENFEITESLCSESQLRFGACEASFFKIRIYNRFIPMKNKWLWVTETLDGNNSTPFSFGIYKVFSDVPTADKEYRDITAYDSMYDIINSNAADWYNEIFPNNDSKVTLKEFRTSFIKKFGLEQEDISLINDLHYIKKTIQIGEDSETETEEEQTSVITESALSGKDVITAICEINGCFGHIGRDGKFQWIYLKKDTQGIYPANDLFPEHSPDYMLQFPDGKLYPKNPESTRIGGGTYKTCKYEDFLTKKIDKVWIRKEEKDAGGIYGEGENCYIIEDNFLVYGESADSLKYLAKNILYMVDGITYRPFEAECIGNPCLEVGDAVRLSTKYELIESYILKRTLKGIQQIWDIYSADGEEYCYEKVNSVGMSIKELKGKTNTLERDSEHTKETISDIETEMQTVIEQTATSIDMSVSNGEKTAGIHISIKNENGEEVGSTDGNIEMTGVVTFNNLENAGQTAINGDNITTGTINCDLLNGGTINGQTFKGGKVTGSTVEANKAYYLIDPDFKDKYRVAYIMATNTNETDIRFGRLSKNDFDSPYNYIAFKEESEDRSFHIYSDKAEIHCQMDVKKITSKSTINFMNEDTSNGIMAYGPDGGTHYMAGYNPTERYSYIGMPAMDSGIGDTSTRLRGNSVVLSSAGSITTSDERLKNSFKTLDEFDSVYMDIPACAFRYNNGTSGRYHFGAKAQDVKDAFEKHGYTTQDFGGFVQMSDNPENEDYCGIDDPMGIIYTEFTMWNMHIIQKLYKKIEQQQAEIDSLKESVSFLMERIGADYGSW